ncbi:MAG: hypothetical protein HQL31_02035 [Planctomycetes bacterium]|nr:hypothetical protein [Planctomycetota bacterium]
MKKIIKLLLLLLLLSAVVVGVLYVLRNVLIKACVDGMQAGGTELSLRSADLQVFPSQGLSFETLRLSKIEGGESLASISRTDASVRLLPLFFGEYHFPEMELKDLVVEHALIQHVESLSAADTEEQVPAADSESFFTALPDLGEMDGRDLLARFTGANTLNSEQRIDSLREESVRLRKKWEERMRLHEAEILSLKKEGEAELLKWKELRIRSDLGREINEIRAQAQALGGQKFDLGNLEGMAASYARFGELKERLNKFKQSIGGLKESLNQTRQLQERSGELLKKLGSLDDELKGDLNRFGDEVKATRGVFKQDLAMLKQEFDPRNFDATKITRLLLGKEWEERLQQAYDLYAFISLLLPPSGPSEPEEGTTPSTGASQGTVWSLGRLAFSSLLPLGLDKGKLSLGGEALNIASQPGLFTEPTTWSFLGKVEGGGNMSLKGVYNLAAEAEGKEQERYAEFTYEAPELGGVKWGPPPVRILFSRGRMDLELRINLSQAQVWQGRGSLRISDHELVAGTEVKAELVKPLQDAVRLMLEKPLDFDLAVKPGEKPSIHFHTDMDEVFREVLKQHLKGLFERKWQAQEAALYARLDQRLQDTVKDGPLEGFADKLSPALRGRAEQLVQSLTGFGSQQDNEVAAYNQQTGELLGDLGAGEEGQRKLEAELRQQLKDRLESEVKKRLEAEARKRFETERVENELKKKLEEEAKQKIQGVGAPGTSEEILKDKIEEKAKEKLDEFKKKFRL